MAEIHRDKNGNPIKGAALHSHIIYTHDGGPEAHDAGVAREAIQQYIKSRHTARKKSSRKNFLNKFLKK